MKKHPGTVVIHKQSKQKPSSVPVYGLDGLGPCLFGPCILAAVTTRQEMNHPRKGEGD